MLQENNNFPADPLSEPQGPPGVRGPQFGNRCHSWI